MIPRMGSVLALTMLVALGSVKVDAQEADLTIARPKPGTFSGRVISRPLVIPLSTAAAPLTSPPANTSIIRPFQIGVANAEVTVTSGLFLQSGVDANVAIRRPIGQTFRAETGKDGSFAIDGLRPGGYYWTVSHPEYSKAEGKFEIGKSAGYRQTIVLTPAPAKDGAFSGHVTGLPTIRPLPAPRPLPPVSGAANDGAGRPGSLEEPQATSIAPYFGEPLSGAIVEATQAFFPQPQVADAQIIAPGQFVPDGRGAARQPQVADAQIIAPRPFKTETDSNGNFSLKGMPLGSYTFKVTAKGYVGSTGRFSLSQFQPRVVRNIALSQRVRGGFSGQVVERSLIRPIPFPLPEQIFKADGSGAKPDDATGQVAPDDPGTGAKKLMPPFVQKPVAGAQVTIRRLFRRITITPRKPPLMPDDPVPDAAQPEGDLSDDEDKTDETAVAGATEAKESDEDEELDLAPATEPAGAGAAGAPGAPSRILPMPPLPKPRYRRTTTNANGKFSLAGLPSGNYRFVVRAKGFRSQAGRFSLSPREPKAYRRIALARRPTVTPKEASFGGAVYTIRFQPPPDPAGGVIDPDPAGGAIDQKGIAILPPPFERTVPLAGVEVELSMLARPGEAVIQSIQTTKTDQNGSFQFKGLRPGPYVVYLSLTGFGSMKEVVTIEGDSARKFYLKPMPFAADNPTEKPVEQPTVQGADTENPFRNK